MYHWVKPSSSRTQQCTSTTFSGKWKARPKGILTDTAGTEAGWCHLLCFCLLICLLIYLVLRLRFFVCVLGAGTTAVTALAPTNVVRNSAQVTLRQCLRNTYE